MKKVLFVLVALCLALLAVLVIRTAMLPTPQPSAAASGPPIVVDTVVAAQRLSEAVRFRTVSLASGAPIDTAAFRGFHEFVARAFPRAHAALTREVVGGLSLLYTWHGSDTSAAPVVLMGHMDVVPVPEENLADWTQPPFSGAIADGYIWGRGTLDDKTTVLATLEAVEGLVAQGFVPPRTVYLTFGHDEEVGGRHGAGAIVAELVKRGVKPALVLDEGGILASGLMPGVAGRAAVVGIAEKGYLSLRLTAKAQGGHSSMPTGRTAVGALSRAIATLEAHPFPLSLDGPTRGMFETLAPYVPYTRKLMLSNLWLTGPLVKAKLGEAPLTAALMHTTIAPTMLQAGVKDNVLPPEASAVINFRIQPGDTQRSVTEYVRRTIADTLITVSPADSAWLDPSPVSDPRSAAFRLIARTIGEVTPGETVPVLPYLVVGGTDARYWNDHSDRVFRFLAVPITSADVSRVHGLNERIRVQDYVMAVRFFSGLLRGLDSLKE